MSMLPVPAGYRRSANPWRDYYSHFVAPIVGYGYKRLRSHWESKTSSNKRRKYNSKPKRGATFATVKSSRRGKTRVKVSKSSTSKKKKSVKKRVTILEKNLPPKSHYIYKGHQFLRMRQITDGFAATGESKTLFWIPGVQPNGVNGSLTSIEFPSGNVNLENRNTKVMVKCYTSLKLKNNSLYNCNLKVGKYKAVAFTNSSPVSWIRSSAIDDGYTFTNNVENAIGATATAARLPERLKLTRTENFYEIMGYAEKHKDWKQLGKLESITLRPGDSTVLVMTHKYHFDPLAFDDDSRTYKKSLDYGLVVQCVGELCRGSPEVNILGYSDYELNGMLKNQYEFIIDNGLGITKIVNTTDKTTQTTDPTAFVAAGANNVIE